MKVIRDAKESEMILEFLKGEYESKRFHNDIADVLLKTNNDKNVIVNGDAKNPEENKKRLQIMKEFRGYPNKELFERFPKNIDWKYAQLETADIDRIYYIDYSYWNELSNGTSKPTEAVKTIKGGKEIFGVPNGPFLEGAEYVKNHSFPPIILLSCNDEKYLIIEGHSRMTVYAFEPERLNGTFAFVGYTSEKEMAVYDKRMLSKEEVKPKK